MVVLYKNIEKQSEHKQTHSLVQLGSSEYGSTDKTGPNTDLWLPEETHEISSVGASVSNGSPFMAETCEGSSLRNLATFGLPAPAAPSSASVLATSRTRGPVGSSPSRISRTGYPCRRLQSSFQESPGNGRYSREARTPVRGHQHPRETRSTSQEADSPFQCAVHDRPVWARRGRKRHGKTLGRLLCDPCLFRVRAA
ncbi:hypothetical protein BD413DRAFT_565212 [Trametes elegans]|nr:hypothetical protein BD413DRAFT_565212 [Trametes elegans]